VARRAQAPKTKKKTVRIEAADFQYTKEKMTYLQAYGGTVLIFLWFGLMGYFFTTNPKAASQHYWQWVYVAFYPIACVLFVNWISAKPRRDQIKKAGNRAKVMGNNFPELHKLITDACRVLGMTGCPDMYVLEDRTPYLYSIPGRNGTILLSTAMRGKLNDSELAALLAHELGHIKCKHLRLELAITWLKSANAMWKIILLPITILSALLRGWMDLIDFTADRAAVIVTGNPALLNAALLKIAIALDPQSEITAQEVDEYLGGGGGMENSKEMVQYFRVGQFIGTQPNLRERIEQIAYFPTTEQAKIVGEKMREMRGGAAPAA
jgi:Zn-dependent protease with chaperone function